MINPIKKYKQNQQKKTIVTAGVFAGVAAIVTGVLTALFTPLSGKEARTKISNEAKKVKASAVSETKVIAGKVKNLETKAKKAAQTASKKVVQIKGDIKKRLEEKDEDIN